MSATAPCVPCCTTPVTVNVPGTTGLDGINGTNGINAFTVTTANFTVPGVGATVGVAVQSSAWMTVGQVVVVQGPGNFMVVATPSTVSATLRFLGYPGDVAPLTVIASGATVSPGGLLGGGWSTLSKKADQSVINSNAMVNDNDLQFAMLANTNYRVRGVVFFDTTAAGDFQYDFFGPAAPVLVRFERCDCIAGGTPAERAIDVVTPGATTLAGAGTTGGYIRFSGIFQNGANPNLFAFQFAQNTATADTGAIVRAGSYMEFSIA